MDEIIQCPTCNGYRCSFILQIANSICRHYNPHRECRHKCSHMCLHCYGKGYINWIDNLFDNNFDYENEKTWFDIRIISKLKENKKLRKKYKELLEWRKP